MRDPELMLRAQRAATELERAWDRWRTMHGLGAIRCHRSPVTSATRLRSHGASRGWYSESRPARLSTSPHCSTGMTAPDRSTRR